MERETKMPLRFVGISYHDGQGFLVPKSIGVNSVFQLSQAAICFLSGTTTQANVEDLFKDKNMTFTPVTFDTIDELVAAFQATGEAKCDAYTADQSQLYAVRLKLADGVVANAALQSAAAATTQPRGSAALAILLSGYMVIMCGVVLTNSRLFMSRLRAEAETDRQKQLIDLLRQFAEAREV